MHHKKFYVTTPIYYVTAKPHLGSLYSTLLADVAARWAKLQGTQTFFMTGSDEHGQKIAEAAQSAGKSPQDFVDGLVGAYKDMWHKYSIAYDYFARTTDEHHIKAVQQLIRTLQSTGDIYKSFYTGYYCTPCETFVTEKESDGEPLCTSCGRGTAPISEESYFFRLSAYTDRLLAFYDAHPDFIVPAERMHEVRSFVKSGLKDLSISRTSVTWGVPFPDDPKHVVYVWAEALQIYISAVGYGNEARSDEFKFWWPADMQVMAKDIVRFHAVYWPIFLMAAQLALPKKLLVHGWLKVNNQKMSKSLGNVVDPQALLDVYGADAVRYYLVRHMAITQDAEFSTIDLEQRISSDLANDLGNLLQRTVTLAHKHSLFEVHPPQVWGVHEITLRDSFWTVLERFSEDMEEGYFSRALGHLWRFIHEVNAYFHAAEPWKIADPARFEEVLSATCHSLAAIGILLLPVMPGSMETLLKSLGVSLEGKADMITELTDNPWNKTFMLTKIPALFQKFEPSTPVQLEEPPLPTITIDEFAKVTLLVGTITDCTEVTGSDKLLKLQVDFGSSGTRQVLSGVKKHFTPAELTGKQAVFVYNLAPRKMMGLESQGMLLTAENEQGTLKIITPAGPVANGTRLK